MSKTATERFEDSIFAVVEGIAVLVLGAVLISSWTEHPEWRLWLIVALAVAAVFGVLWLVWRRRRGQSESLPVEQRPKDAKIKQLGRNVDGNNSNDDLVEVHSFDGELDPMEIALLLHMAENPPPDRRPIGFAVDLGMVEGRAEYHLERLRGLGLVRLRGFALGSGYELTQKGRSFLVEGGFI